MIQKNIEITIENENIFEEDKLNRRESIEDLSLLIKSISQPFVFSINANWGAGKTTFVKLWKAHLQEKHQVHSIYFSAWEDDFSQEPLLAILSELNQFVSENFKDDSEIISKMQETKEFGVKVLKRGIPAFVKGATAGVLDIDKGMESAIGAISESIATEVIDSYSKDKAITEQFKKNIEDLIRQIDTDKPFVIFIDELDRCRPLYAIELLERIKHLFNIKKLIFILSIDKKQLSESIKSQYGNIDTDNYLRRFIDLEYNLPSVSKDRFCEFLHEKFEFDKILRTKGIDSQSSDVDYLEWMKVTFRIFELSLREIEQIFIKLNILFRTIKQHHISIYFSIFIFLVSFKTYDEDAYDNLVNNSILLDKIKKLIDMKLIEEKSYMRNLINATIQATIYKDVGYAEYIKTQEDELKSGNIFNPDLRDYIAILKYRPRRSHVSLEIIVKNVIKKIDFSEKFDFSTV